MILGLTGGYCAGKNAVAELLERRGFLCVDVDKLGHEALGSTEAARAVAERFGAEMLAQDGAINRKDLGARVFGRPEELAALEGIVHPIVYRLLEERFWKAAAGRDVCLNAALLYRVPDAAFCDAIIEVRAPLLLRLRRGMRRDGLSALHILKSIMSQRALWRMRRVPARPILVLWNAGSRKGLERRLARVLGRARILASRHPAPERSKRTEGIGS